eukprot:6180176-Pleurochrysis_carterae.AAC.2
MMSELPGPWFGDGRRCPAAGPRPGRVRIPAVPAHASPNATRRRGIELHVGSGRRAAVAKESEMRPNRRWPMHVYAKVTSWRGDVILLSRRLSAGCRGGFRQAQAHRFAAL